MTEAQVTEPHAAAGGITRPQDARGALRNHKPLGLALLVFAGLGTLLMFTTKSEVTLAGNESSRLAAAQSVVDTGTFAIDHSIFHTVDKVKIGDHFYSDKPVLLIYWLAFVYWALHALLGFSFQTQYHLTIYLVTLLGIGVFTLVLSALFFIRLRAAGFPFGLQLIGSTAVVLTTWILSYSGTVNSHTPAACMLFASFLLLDRGPSDWRTTLGAGLLTGVLFNLDVPTGSIVFLGSLAFLAPGAATRQQPLATFAGGFAALVALMLVLDYLAFGDVRPAGLIPGGKDFAGSIHSLGIGGQRRPLHLPTYWYDITFGARGLFSHMPVLLFVIPAAIRAGWREPRTAVQIITLLSVFFFFGCLTGDYGGWAYGFRYLIPLIPLLFWFALQWLRERQHWAPAVVFHAALVVGLISSLVGAYNPWPICYEGASTEPTDIGQEVRRPFTANLLCLTFEWDPDSRLTRYLAEDVYPPELSRAYLQFAFTNMKRPDLVQRARARSRASKPTS